MSVYLIGDRNSGKILNAKEGIFDDIIGLNSFFPSKHIAYDFAVRTLENGLDVRYAIVEADIIKFEQGEIIVGCEQFIEMPSQKKEMVVCH